MEKIITWLVIAVSTLISVTAVIKLMPTASSVPLPTPTTSITTPTITTPTPSPINTRPIRPKEIEDHEIETERD